MTIRPDLIASRFAALPSGPTLFGSFEQQAGVPVDGGRQLLRDLSPFTIRILPPEVISSNSEAIEVNLRGRANADSRAQQQNASEARSVFGLNSVSGNQTTTSLSTLQRIVSAGQIVSGSSSTERAVFTDALTAADIAYQVELLLSIPPLTLLVNPKDMTISYNTIQQYQNRSRDGFIFERWGEGQPTISFSGTTGGFIAGAGGAKDPTQTRTSSPSGIQWASRRDSAAFQNFISLYQFYRNNGYIFDLIGRSRAHHMVGALSITYDQRVYVGHITSFTYSYNQTMMHRLEWSMDFTVDRSFDLAQTPGLVAPLRAPSPGPSYPSGISSQVRALSQGSPSSVRGKFVQVSGVEQYAESPLQAFVPSGIL